MNHVRPNTLLVIAIAAGSLVSSGDEQVSPKQLILTGRYEEAKSLLDSRDSADALLLFRSYVEQGKYDDARKIDFEDPSAQAFAARAELCYLEGRFEQAAAQAKSAIDQDANCVAARWLLAEIHRRHGRYDEAKAGYKWLVDFYNEQDEINDPRALHCIGLAAAQYARWTRNPQQFRFLVNDFYPSILKLEPNYWPAHVESARLFLEKFNRKDATRELNKALAINPLSPDILAARAALAMQGFDLDRAEVAIDAALATNSRHREALQLKADWLMANFRVREAIDILTKEAVPRYGQFEEIRGRLAAAHGYVEGANSPDDDASQPRMQQLIREANQVGMETGELHEVVADTFDLLRKYPNAAEHYQRAVELAPQLVGPRGQLGLMHMRLGDEVAARRLLDESFEIDPFNVRVKNSLAVLDVLAGYAELETEHFILRFDRGKDDLLAQEAARYLEEEVYPDLVEQLGYEPEGKTLIEFFSRAKNTSGHGWFSARMVGLPYIGTVGACAGKMVALASPNDMDDKYNWARVLRHEFVHVVNLQQTDFQIPHWFTEALAVRSEGFPRPSEWTTLLARRHAADELFNLDTINLGFMRPGSGDDWTLAYCQAELYAEYMVAGFGEDALAKMLDAYASHLDTPAAIRHCFGVGQQEFEAGYSKHVAKVVAEAGPLESTRRRKLTELEAAIADNPDDATTMADLAYAHLQRRSNPDARRWALKSLKQDPKQQLAAYVLARQYLSIGDVPAAEKFLADHFDEETPQENALMLLAAMHIKAKRYDEAARLYRLAEVKLPHPDRWLKLLAGVYLRSGEDDKLAKTLSQLVESDTDNLPYRRKLLALAQARGDTEAAGKWASQIIHIDVTAGYAHAACAGDFAHRQKHDRAIDGYETALRIDGSQTPWRLAKARSEIAVNRVEQAKVTLKQILSRQPDHAEAKRLLTELAP